MVALVVLAGQVAVALERGATADLLMVMQEPLTQAVAAVAEKQAQTAALASSSSATQVCKKAQAAP
jgi:hypothetical protein